MTVSRRWTYSPEPPPFTNTIPYGLDGEMPLCCSSSVVIAATPAWRTRGSSAAARKRESSAVASPWRPRATSATRSDAFAASSTSRGTPTKRGISGKASYSSWRKSETFSAGGRRSPENLGRSRRAASRAPDEPPRRSIARRRDRHPGELEADPLEVLRVGERELDDLAAVEDVAAQRRVRGERPEAVFVIRQSRPPSRSRSIEFAKNIRRCRGHHPRLPGLSSACNWPYRRPYTFCLCLGFRALAGCRRRRRTRRRQRRPARRRRRQFRSRSRPR